MSENHYEIEPRPAAVGGGRRLRLFSRDPETGEHVEMGGGVFPGECGEDCGNVYDPYADAMQVGEDWLSTRFAEQLPYPGEEER